MSAYIDADKALDLAAENAAGIAMDITVNIASVDHCRGH